MGVIGSTSQVYTNLFPIANQDEIAIRYQLFEIRNIAEDGAYEKNMMLLKRLVAKAYRTPVFTSNVDGVKVLVVPEGVPLEESEWQLTPHMARLRPQGDIRTLAFNSMTQRDREFACEFVRGALDRVLGFNNRSLWRRGGGWCEKTPNGRRGKVSIYPGFKTGVVALDSGQLACSVEIVHHYVENDWQTQADERPYKGKHFLYHFGDQWYVVQMWKILDTTIAEQKFIPPNGDPADVYSYTKDKCNGCAGSWISELRPDSPAIFYGYTNQPASRYGALSLCKRVVSTDDDDARSLQRSAILDPAVRLDRSKVVVQKWLRDIQIGGRVLRIDGEPLKARSFLVQVPDLRFGAGRILHVRTGHEAGIDVCQYGRERQRLLTEKGVGPLDQRAFGMQALCVPKSLPREVAEDFHKSFVEQVNAVSGSAHYNPVSIVYDDTHARTLSQQIASIEEAFRARLPKQGYITLVLPERTGRALHDQIKQKLWPDYQLQCASAGKILGFYRRSGGRHVFNDALMSKFGSYLRNTAFGLLITNRKWLWAVESPLNYDAYVGIDVLNRRVGFSYVLDNTKTIVFQDAPINTKERLSKQLIKMTLCKHLRDLIPSLPRKPRHIVIHRDGRTFATEMRGIEEAIRSLRDDGTLPMDVTWGIVEITKSSADKIRFFERSGSAVRNVRFGTAFCFDWTRGVLATTGFPFAFPGTSNPIAARIVRGELDVSKILEDMFYLAQLGFAAPTASSRLPATISIADAFLEPIASYVEDEGMSDDESADGEESLVRATGSE